MVKLMWLTTYNFQLINKSTYKLHLRNTSILLNYEILHFLFNCWCKHESNWFYEMKFSFGEPKSWRLLLQTSQIIVQTITRLTICMLFRVQFIWIKINKFQLTHKSKCIQIQRKQHSHDQMFRFFQKLCHDDDQFSARLRLLAPIRLKKTIRKSTSRQHDFVSQICYHDYIEETITNNNASHSIHHEVFMWTLSHELIWIKR